MIIGIAIRRDPESRQNDSFVSSELNKTVPPRLKTSARARVDD